MEQRAPLACRAYRTQHFPLHGAARAPGQQQQGQEPGDYQQPWHGGRGEEGAAELSPIPQVGVCCPEPPSSTRSPVLQQHSSGSPQRPPDKLSPSRVMRHKSIWLLFSNYIKPVLLKSVPSRDNALDTFDWLEEERGGKATLA